MRNSDWQRICQTIQLVVCLFTNKSIDLHRMLHSNYKDHKRQHQFVHVGIMSGVTQQMIRAIPRAVVDALREELIKYGVIVRRKRTFNSYVHL